MPNFNGAIVVHTLQLIKTPATLREIVVTIAKNTDLPQEDLMKPVKQTLDMGYRMGFLQKLNGRYFLVPMTFDTLMAEIKSSGQPGQIGQPARKTGPEPEKAESKLKMDKKSAKQHHKQLALSTKNHNQSQYQTVLDHESTTTLMPQQTMHLKPDALMIRKPKRSQVPPIK
ncbi:uncharacterized protein [Drosophila virilis]|uniref:DUF4777 domain-containing protein n=1 Tax=Drosophila virilis TaxID=7244 RepID=B4LVL0_DROVI|nr:uncharacterized protein LOC6627571 [Drosophila virilis]EDW64404.1 uncharacterized protein Dvir_GJ17451 [Drosophila virilis]